MEIKKISETHKKIVNVFKLTCNSIIKNDPNILYIFYKNNPNFDGHLCNKENICLFWNTIHFIVLKSPNYIHPFSHFFVPKSKRDFEKWTFLECPKKGGWGFQPAKNPT